MKFPPSEFSHTEGTSEEPGSRIVPVEENCHVASRVEMLQNVKRKKSVIRYHLRAVGLYHEGNRSEVEGSESQVGIRICYGRPEACESARQTLVARAAPGLML